MRNLPTFCFPCDVRKSNVFVSITMTSGGEKTFYPYYYSAGNVIQAFTDALNRALDFAGVFWSPEEDKQRQRQSGQACPEDERHRRRNVCKAVSYRRCNEGSNHADGVNQAHSGAPVSAADATRFKYQDVCSYCSAGA
jgi:hypothetical protein